MTASLLADVVPSWAQHAEAHGLFPARAGLHEEQRLASPLVSPAAKQSLVARDLARRALRACGGPADLAIRRGPGGAPEFPRGFLGSLTHTRNFAGAAVARDDGGSIGIDVEQASRSLGVEAPFATPRERRMLGDLFAGDPSTAWDVLLFSAKEAAYKALYPLDPRFRAMTSVEALLRPDGRFTVWLPADSTPRPGRHRVIHGRWTSQGGLVAAFASLPPVSQLTPSTALSSEDNS